MIDLLSTQLKGVLENAIFKKILAQNLNISDATLRAIVSRIAEETASTVATSVFKSANLQINSIPNNLLGIKNPVNIVNANQNSNNITNNLTNILDKQITGQVTNTVVVSLERELRKVLPTDKANLINFHNLAAILVQSITPTISSTVNTALKSFTTGLFNNSKSITQIIPGADKFFTLSGGNSAAALDKVNESYAVTNTNKYLEQSRNFDINNTENNEKLAVVKQGFTDPNANYPTKEYSGKPDTNKLATGDITGGSVVQTKNLERMKGAKLPGGDSWDEPESAYKAEYPYNKVTQTESGHIIEIDDTPGASRLHIYHAAGTYIEIDSNGSMVRRTRGSSYEIIDRNGKIAISGEADISINGECNIYVGNDANIEVDGDTNITCHNDITAQAAGNVNLSAGDTFNLTGGNVNIQAYNDMNITSNTSLNMHSTESFNILSNVELSLHASETINMHSNAEISVQAVDLYTYSETAYNQATGDYNIVAGGDFSADTGGDAHINSGNAAESKESTIAALASVSKIGTIAPRKDIVYITLEDPTPLTLADSFTLDNEEDRQISEEVKAHRDKLLLSGFASSDDLDGKPVEQDSVQISSVQTTTVPGDENLKKVNSLPGNYNLSPNFTLEMLTTKAALTKDSIETSELTYGEIVFNLQQVALNVLEPVYNLYPNAFVTSAYRQRAKSSKTSQHPLGCAVDIQFKGASKQDYFEIAKRLAKALKYDQLLLEFCSYTNNPWVHISYTGKTERVQVSTYWNHKKHSDGLIQLA